MKQNIVSNHFVTVYFKIFFKKLQESWSMRQPKKRQKEQQEQSVPFRLRSTQITES